MVERCRCGAELLPTLHFCVGCGVERAPLALPRQRTGSAFPGGSTAPADAGWFAAAVEVPAQRTAGVHAPQVDVPRQRAGSALPVVPAAATDRGPAPRPGSGPAGHRHPVATQAGPRNDAARQPGTWYDAATQTGLPTTTAAPAAPPVVDHPFPQVVPMVPAGWSPAPAGRSSTPWIVAVLLLVAVLPAGVALFALRPDLLTGVRATTPAATTPVAPVGAGVPATVQPAVPPVITAPVPSVQLADQVAIDSGRVAATVGYWVPQLSSKRAGTVDGGVSYDDRAILDHYRGLAAQHPGAALLWSGDWPVFQRSDYWVVVVAQPYSTAAGANAWCDAQGFGADDCFAKQLSYYAGPQGTTVHR
ncbi:hypothetical protein WIS52_30975 [Pseudonocardia nematodicida]|uniref:Serine/threonine protein kinase n=1 Tax=Pseudonocardia nematodicida TaxID=1206997 RepID=A0ABV1KKC4_9PSEU